MSQQTRDQDQLPAVMCFMRHKVRQEVLEVRWKILPGCSWHFAARSNSQPDESLDPLAAARQRPNQLEGTDPPGIHEPRRLNLVTSAQRFDPAAPAVVNVRSHVSRGQPW